MLFLGKVEGRSVNSTEPVSALQSFRTGHVFLNVATFQLFLNELWSSMER